MFFRERMRKLRNKAKTLLDDETSQENEENYARRLMQGDSGLSPSKQAGLACHSDYTQMWELRRSQPLLQPSGEPNTDGVPSQQSASTIAAPACCNKTTFITFKPREPIYERSRFSALLHKNLNGVPLYFEYEPGASGDRPASQGPGDNTYKRPDLITNSGRRASDASQASGAVPRTVKFRDDRRCAEGQRDMCDHCALHASSERILDEPSSPPASDQSVQAVWSGQVALSDDDDAQALWGPRVFMGRHHHPEGSGQPRDKEGYIKLIVICNGLGAPDDVPAMLSGTYIPAEAKWKPHTVSTYLWWRVPPLSPSWPREKIIVVWYQYCWKGLVFGASAVILRYLGL